MGGACSNMFREEVYIYIGFWWENMKKGEYLEDRSVDRGIILRMIFRIGMWVIDRI